jgi:hypothetical protein
LSARWRCHRTSIASVHRSPARSLPSSASPDGTATLGYD